MYENVVVLGILVFANSYLPKEMEFIQLIMVRACVCVCVCMYLCLIAKMLSAHSRRKDTHTHAAI